MEGRCHGAGEGHAFSAAALAPFLTSATDHGNQGRVFLDNQTADAGDAAELVSAEGQIVHAKGLEVHGDLAHSCGRVTGEQSVVGVTPNGVDVENLAGLIVGHHVGEAGAVRAVGVIHGGIFQNGVVLVTAGEGQLAGVGAQTFHHPVTGFRCSAGEVNFLRETVQVLSDTFPCALQRLFRGDAAIMQGTGVAEGQGRLKSVQSGGGGRLVGRRVEIVGFEHGCGLLLWRFCQADHWGGFAF